MAYDRSPINDTTSTQRIKLTREINARDGGAAGKDEDLINVFIEPIVNKAAQDNRHFIVKRAGVSIVEASVASAKVRGMFFWEDASKLYYAVSNDIYVYNVNTGVSVTLANPFGTTTGEVGFCLFLYDDGTSKVCATDGTTLITIDSSNTVVTVSDPDLPSPHLPQPVFLDGYLFLAKSGTASIYNSDLNDPTAWTAGNVIDAELEGDDLIRIAKLNNYLLAFGSTSVEYFWDAAEATGSPLNRNDTPIKINSYLGGFAQFGNNIFYIGVNLGGQPDVYKLSDFRIEELGTPTISRFLNSTGRNIADWAGTIVSFKGHTFYVLNASDDITYVYDVDTKLWARWAYQGTSNFPIVAAATVQTTANVFSYFAQKTDTSTIYKFDEDLFQDNSTNFTCVVVTEASDFGTLNRKTMRRLSFIGDRPTANADLSVQWSDDDYQTYSTARTVNLNQDLPCLYNLGWFRQRNFKLSFTANENLRLQEMEAEINKGRS